MALLHKNIWLTNRLCILLAGFFIMLFCMGSLSPAFAATPITQVDVFARGTTPSWIGSGVYTNSIDITSNGIPTSAPASGPPGSVGTIVARWPGGFVSNKVSIGGNPGVVSTVFTFTAVEYVSCGSCCSYYETHTATVTIDVNVNTGAVTASGTDSTVDNRWFGASATLTADASSAAGASVGSFSLSAAGDVTDRTVRSCVNFASGLQACTDVFPLNIRCDATASPPITTNCETVPPATDPAANDPAQNAEAENNYSKAIQLMADQLTNVMLYQLPIIGVLLDSKHQLETQRLFGETAAKAHREYAPSEQVCAFGTLARSTSPSKYKVDDNVSIINTILQKRELLNISMPSAFGPAFDRQSRLDKWRTVYCDKNDSNKEIGETQLGPPPVALCQAPSSLRINKDIDYRRTMLNKMTLDVDFTDTTSTPDEEDILALAKNLYASTTLTSIPQSAIAPSGTYRELQDMRMLSAVRSVERTSFATAAAMRAKGSGLNAAQLKQVMQNLGVPAADVTALVGDNPSYFAQMEMITQKLYQDPTFYSNLYTNPANVARMKVVLQAVRLMADRDKFEQALRREMLISMLLEMRLRKLGETTENQNAQSSPRE